MIIKTLNLLLWYHGICCDTNKSNYFGMRRLNKTMYSLDPNNIKNYIYVQISQQTNRLHVRFDIVKYQDSEDSHIASHCTKCNLTGLAPII